MITLYPYDPTDLSLEEKEAAEMLAIKLSTNNSATTDECSIFIVGFYTGLQWQKQRGRCIVHERINDE